MKDLDQVFADTTKAVVLKVIRRRLGSRFDESLVPEIQTNQHPNDYEKRLVNAQLRAGRFGRPLRLVSRSSIVCLLLWLVFAAYLYDTVAENSLPLHWQDWLLVGVLSLPADAILLFWVIWSWRYKRQITRVHGEGLAL